MCQVKLTKEYIAKDVAVIKRAQREPSPVAQPPIEEGGGGAAGPGLPSTVNSARPQLSSSLLLPEAVNKNANTSTPPSTNSSSAKEALATTSSAKQAGQQHQAVQMGYIAATKESFGFIETMKHDRDIFFHNRYVRFSQTIWSCALNIVFTSAC